MRGAIGNWPSERRLPANEAILDVTLLAWEAAHRKHLEHMMRSATAEEVARSETYGEQSVESYTGPTYELASHEQ